MPAHAMPVAGSQLAVGSATHRYPAGQAARSVPSQLSAGAAPGSSTGVGAASGSGDDSPPVASRLVFAPPPPEPPQAQRSTANPRIAAKRTTACIGTSPLDPPDRTPRRLN